MSYATKPKPKFVGDREAATYRWELYLFDNGYIFDGYSKSKNHNEKHDKQALFQDCVARICANGYLDKTFQMLWYARGGALAHKKEDRLILEMYPTHFKAHNELQLDLATVAYLQRLYDAKALSKVDPVLYRFDPQSLLPPRASKRDGEAIDFAFSLLRFPNEEVLVEHCKRLINTYEYKRVEAWWKKCKEAYLTTPEMPEPMTYYPRQPSPQLQQTLAMQPATAPVSPENAQMIQNAQNTMSGLHNKWSSNRK